MSGIKATSYNLYRKYFFVAGNDPPGDRAVNFDGWSIT
jgi:hypothetical protein